MREDGPIKKKRRRNGNNGKADEDKMKRPIKQLNDYYKLKVCGGKKPHSVA